MIVLMEGVRFRFNGLRVVLMVALIVKSETNHINRRPTFFHEESRSLGLNAGLQLGHLKPIHRSRIGLVL
jgi:hypothetical protein